MPSTVMPSAILPRMSCRPGHSDASWRARSRTAGVSSSSRHGGAHSPSSAVGEAALVGGLEVADLLDLVAPELHPERMLLRRREHVEQTAAHRDLAAPLDHLDARVADVDQLGDGVVHARALASRQLDRRQLAEAAHHRLEQAADRRRDDLERPRAHVGRIGMSQPAQDREPLTGGVRPRRQPLVRQRLPGREVADLVLPEQRPERGRQFLGLACGRGHRERERHGGRRLISGPVSACVGRGRRQRAPATSSGRSEAGAIRSPPSAGSSAAWSSAWRRSGSAVTTGRRPERLIASLHRQHERPAPKRQRGYWRLASRPAAAARRRDALSLRPRAPRRPPQLAARRPAGTSRRNCLRLRNLGTESIRTATLRHRGTS